MGATRDGIVCGANNFPRWCPSLYAMHFGLHEILLNAKIRLCKFQRISSNPLGNLLTIGLKLVQNSSPSSVVRSPWQPVLASFLWWELETLNSDLWYFLYVDILKPLNLSHLRLASTFSSSKTTRQDIAATEHTRITTLFTGEGK